VAGIKLNSGSNSLMVDAVKFVGLNGSLVVGPDGRMNLQTILQDQLGKTLSKF